jgi:hypothetical protein
LGPFSVSFLLQLPVALKVFQIFAAILPPVCAISLLPGLLALSFVGPIVRIHLLFFPLPFILSCLLAGPGATVPLIFHPWVSPQNPSATGAPKCDLFHPYLHSLSDLSLGKTRIKRNYKGKNRRRST